MQDQDFDWNKGGFQEPAAEPIPPATPSEEQSKPIENQAATPLATEAAATEAAQVVFNPKEVFGEQYESVDFVKSRLQAAEELSQKVKELESRQVTFANDYVRELNEVLRKGISKEAFDQVYFSDPSKLDDAQKLMLSLQWEKGFSEQDAREIIEHKYKLGEYEIDSDPDVRVARLMLKADAKEADKFLEQYRQKQMTPPTKPDHTHIVQAWEPVIPNLLDKVKTITLGDISYNFPQDVVNQAKKEIGEFIGNDFQGDSKNPEHQAFISQIMSDRVRALGFEKAITHFQTELEKKFISKEANPRRDAGNTQLGKSATQAESEASALAQFLAKGYH